MQSLRGWLLLAVPVWTLGACVSEPTGALYSCWPDAGCPAGLECRGADFLCVPPGSDGGSPDGCVPLACAQGMCGRSDDGCGGQRNCGDCPAPLACGAVTPGQCGCPIGVGGAGEETVCVDLLDNDCDGLTDCLDPDCEAKTCSDDRQCTVDDVCVSGACVGTVSCLSAGKCEIADAGACGPTGECVYPPKMNGVACNDGLACTTGDVCTNGSCGGNNACTQPGVDCRVQIGTCQQNGTCNYDLAPAGTPCTADNNPCTADRCNSTGTCIHPPANEGNSCNDGRPCTTGDVCTNGTCKGITSCNSPPATGCYEPTGSCAADGGCTYPKLPNNTGCDDQKDCTSNDVCSNGFCVGQMNCVQPAEDCKYTACNSAGFCATFNQSGGCTDDGNPCTRDTCVSGVCTHPNENDKISCGTSMKLDCGGGASVSSSRCMECQAGTCVVNSPEYNSSCQPSCAEVTYLCSGVYSCSSNTICAPAYDCATCCKP